MGTGEELHFTQLKRGTGVSAEIRMAAQIIGILRVHSERPKDERGVADITLRQFFTAYCPAMGPLLITYASAFGNYGENVLVQYAERLGGEVGREHLEKLAEEAYQALKRKNVTPELVRGLAKQRQEEVQAKASQDMPLAAGLLAILKFHAEQGKAKGITLRQLADQEVVAGDLLKEYVCAFGVQGRTAVMRYVTSLGEPDASATTSTSESIFARLQVQYA